MLKLTKRSKYDVETQALVCPQSTWLGACSMWTHKPQLHIHDFGHGRATTDPDLSSRDASAWVVAAT